MNQNEHFSKLITSINASTNNNKNFKQNLIKLTNSKFTNNNEKSNKTKYNNQSVYKSVDIFNHLDKIDKNKFINLNINSQQNKIMMSVLYSINYNEYNLITNKEEIVDNLCTNILIEFNRIFKSKEYKNIAQKRKIRDLVENYDISKDLFLMIMADYLDINLVMFNNRLIKFINQIENRATILIYVDSEDVYTLDSIQEFTTIDLLKKKYSKHYKNYEAIRLKSISSYKLSDLQQICDNFNIVINPNKRLKKDVYDTLLKFFKF